MIEISESLIRSIASEESIRKALRFYQRGFVTIRHVEEDFVRAVVQSGSVHNVELQKRNGTIETSCTCPFDWDGECKHVVAVMMALLYGEQQTSAPHRSSHRMGWKSAINVLLPLDTAAGTMRRTVPPWRVAYALGVHNEYRTIVPLRIRTLKNGGDAKPTVIKQYNGEDNDHFDHIDRILLEKINGKFTTTVVEKNPISASPAYFNFGAMENDGVMTDLLMLLRGKEVYAAKKDGAIGARLTVCEEEGCIGLEIKEERHALELNLTVRINGHSADISECVVLCKKPLWLLTGTTIIRTTGAAGEQVLAFQKVKHITVPHTERETFLRMGLPLLLPHYSVQSRHEFLQTIDVEPVPCLYLREVSAMLVIELRFKYGEFELEPLHRMPFNGEFDASQGKTIHIVRRHEKEKEWMRTLSEARVISHDDEEAKFKGGPGSFTPKKNPLEWLAVELPKFRSAGFEIYGQENLKRYRLRLGAPAAAIKVSSGIDWFDVRVEAVFEQSRASFESIARALQKKERFVKLEDGSFGVLPEVWMQKFHRILALASSKSETMRLARTQSMIIDDLAAEFGEPISDDEYKHFRTRLSSFDSIREHPLPEGMHASLRPYQHAGFQWLRFLQEFRFGGILADDMGLGKTIQTLALLQDSRERGINGVSIVIVPTSLVFNWEHEAQRFTPALRVYSHRGTQRVKSKEIFENVDLIITSYGILRRDIEFLKDFHFHYVVLDESQNIKNTLSVNAKAARLLKADYRLALSGTPVENNLAELWSQFAFLNPGMLGTLRSFTENYARPIERDHDKDCADSLQRLLYPFILRRTKEIVASDLPPKQETVVYCEMENDQRSLYAHWREYYRRTVTRSIEAVGLYKSKMKVLEGLTMLRQVCCHPGLVDLQYHGTSGKFETFIEMLDGILAEGHKALVFSQYVKMLKIIRRHCDARAMAYEYLDGQTRDRKERVDRFQNDESVRLFLISLKAGGTGLNLTGADYVFHFDPWWNPAVEMQATDRTHRIGQTKKVFSYKLITKDTVEEKILQLQEKKKELVRDIITTESGVMKSLTKEDVELLFT
ncbi:MAG TPA: SNF2-related protein [Bacteroidota bacterium]|nr:SNF2-related protein [Bacteroidota bacterium]